MDVSSMDDPIYAFQCRKTFRFNKFYHLISYSLVLMYRLIVNAIMDPTKCNF